MKNRKMRTFKRRCGFTLVELILVVLILSIAAVVAIPMFSSAADIQVRSAANCIAADLDYARGLAITRQKNYTVVFVPTTSPTGINYYYLRDADGNIIDNPLTGKKYIVPYKVASTFTVSIGGTDYPAYPDSRVSGVRIDSVEEIDDLGNESSIADNAITFDYLGTPYRGNVASSGTSLSGKGVITLKSRDGAFTVGVYVEPLTGSVTIE